jgi:uncharacterized membrane protein YfcA
MLDALSPDDLTKLLALSGALFAAGAFAGVLAGLLGVGGGIVIVPVLFIVFDIFEVDPGVRMHVAVGTSLATIVLTSTSSARAHLKRGSVDTALIRQWAPWLALGVVSGSIIGGLVSGEVLTGVFGVIAILVALNFGLRPDAKALADSLPGRWVQRAIGGGIGLFSVMMGIGGGTLTVPILSTFNYPIRKAVGTAAAIGLMISVPGVIGFLWSGLDVPNRPYGSLGYVNLIGFALIVPASTLCAPLGARIAHAIDTRLLKRLFGLFLFISAVRMLASL